MKRGLLLSAAIAAMSFAGVANADQLLSSFETAPGLTKNPAGYVSMSSEWATEATNSVKLTNVPAGWWNDAGSVAWDGGSAGANGFKQHTTLSVDYNVLSTVGDWHDETVLVPYVQGEGLGWTALAATTIFNGYNSHTGTASWDISALTMYNYNMPWEPSWAEIGFVIQNGNGLGTTMYLDNLRVTPEPASLSLLAVGSLLALRRRH